MADLIDNSPWAAVRRIVVLCHSNGFDSTVYIHDDGRGIGKATLGYDLKTASPSKDRYLPVASCAKGWKSVSVRRWDLDLFADSSEWWLLRSGPAQVAVPSLLRRTGTVVVSSKELSGVETELGVQLGRKDHSRKASVARASHPGVPNGRAGRDAWVPRSRRSVMGPSTLRLDSYRRHSYLGRKCSRP